MSEGCSLPPQLEWGEMVFKKGRSSYERRQRGTSLTVSMGFNHNRILMNTLAFQQGGRIGHLEYAVSEDNRCKLVSLAETEISLQRNPAGFLLTDLSTGVLVHNHRTIRATGIYDRTILEGATEELLLFDGALCYMQNLAWRLQSNKWICLHAAGLKIGDNVVALCGHKGAGKTSITIALTRAYRDWTFLDNDKLLVHPVGESLEAHCWIQSMLLGVGTLRHYPMLLKQLIHPESLGNCLDSDKVFLTRSEVSAIVPMTEHTYGRLRIMLILIPGQALKKAEVRRLSPEDGYRYMLELKEPLVLDCWPIPQSVSFPIYSEPTWGKLVWLQARFPSIREPEIVAEAIGRAIESIL